MRVKAENLWSVEGPELRHRSGSSRLWSNSVSVSPGEERREGHVSTPQPSVISVFTITGWTETIRRCSHIHQWIQTFRLTRFCCLWLLLPLHHVTVLRSSAVSQDGSGPVQTGSAGGGQSQGQVPLSTESCYYPVSVGAEPSVLNRRCWTVGAEPSVRLQERRPFLASECSELPKAEKWRRQVKTLVQDRPWGSDLVVPDSVVLALLDSLCCLNV